MKLVELQRKLIAAARLDRPSDHVPYQFQKRILALITAQPVLDRWAAWARALWAASVPCVAVMLLLSAWTFLTPARENPSPDLSQQFDTAMLAPVDQDDVSW